MRIAFGSVFGQADLPQHFGHALPHGFLVQAGFVHAQAFGYDVRHLHARVERAERVLEHHLYFPPHFAPPFPPAYFQTAFRFNQPHQCFGQRGFAAAALADDAQRFTRLQFKRQRLQQRFPPTGKPAAFFAHGDGNPVGLDDNRAVPGHGAHVASGGGIEQQLGVVVARGGKHFGRRTLLHHAALLHDDDVVGKTAHEVQIVRDVQQGHVAGLLQAGKQVEYLRLHGDIQRGGRFVGNQEFRLGRHGHRYHRPLPLAA